MKIENPLSFWEKPGNQIIYFAKDKPEVVGNFNKEIVNKIKQLSQNPYYTRESIYFDRSDIRDLIIKTIPLYIK